MEEGEFSEAREDLAALESLGRPKRATTGRRPGGGRPTDPRRGVRWFAILFGGSEETRETGDLYRNVKRNRLIISRKRVSLMMFVVFFCCILYILYTVYLTSFASLFGLC